MIRNGKETEVCVGYMMNTLVKVEVIPGTGLVGNRLVIKVSPRIDVGFSQTIEMLDISKQEILEIAQAFAAAACAMD